MIKLQAIGHLGQDANFNIVNGKTVINFSVAHSHKYKDAAGLEKTNTIWVSCSWWIERTNIVQYLTKGTQVFVDGTPDISTYRDKEGLMKAQLRLRIDNVQLLGSKDREDNNTATAAPSIPPEAMIDNDPDDLPF